MSKRKKIIIAVIAVIILIIIAVLIWWWLQNRVLPATVAPAANANVGLQIPANLPNRAAVLPSEPAGPVKQADVEADMKSLAMTFSERFGSYSNDGNYVNLDTLRKLSTDKLNLQLNILKAKQTAAATYYGVTTKALSAQITSYDAGMGRAEVTVYAQRREAQGTTANPTVYYQNLNLQLAKAGDVWLVDFAEWVSR